MGLAAFGYKFIPPRRAHLPYALSVLAQTSTFNHIFYFSYFGSQQPPLSTLLMDALLRPIKGTYGKGRLHAPTILEQVKLIRGNLGTFGIFKLQASICRRQPTVMEFNLSNGEKYAAEVDSWISAEECVQKVLRHK